MEQGLANEWVFVSALNSIIMSFCSMNSSLDYQNVDMVSHLLHYACEFFLFFSIFCLFLFLLSKGLTWYCRLYFTVVSKEFFTMNLFEQIFGFCFFVIVFFYCIVDAFFNKRFYFFEFSFFSDQFILIIKDLIWLSCFFVFVSSLVYFEFDDILKSFEYFILVLLSILGMFLLLSSNDFLSLYVTIELQSLALYVLAALKQNSLFSIEAGLKYFILGTFSSGLLLFGISLLYGLFGTLNFNELNSVFDFGILTGNNYLFKLGLLFFFSALLFKFSAAPFHMWAPDVYHGAPTILTFFFSLVPKILFLALFMRIYISMFSAFEIYLQLVFFICGIFSLFIGSFGSIPQIKLKRLLAYSSIVNIGYVLMGLSSGQLEGFVALFLFFFVYIFALSVIFFVFIGLRYFSNNFEFRTIFEFAGLLTNNPTLSIFFILSFFSLLALPPFPGFLGKFYLFLISIGSEFFFFLLNSILGSIVSVIVYLRVIRLSAFNKNVNGFFLRPFSSFISLFTSLLILFNLLIFLFPTNFFTGFYSTMLILIQDFVLFVLVF